MPSDFQPYGSPAIRTVCDRPALLCLPLLPCLSLPCPVLFRSIPVFPTVSIACDLQSSSVSAAHRYLAAVCYVRSLRRDTPP